MISITLNGFWDHFAALVGVVWFVWFCATREIAIAQRDRLRAQIDEMEFEQRMRDRGLL